MVLLIQRVQQMTLNDQGVNLMTQISVVNLLKEVSERKHLVTRPLGMEIREKIIKYIISNESKVVTIDFDEVGIIDYSGADEVIVRLINRVVNKELGERFIILKNLEPIHRDNIKAAFQINKKFAVLELQNDHLSLIGNIKPMLTDILIKIYNEQIMTARNLADLTNSEINLAGTKLLQLYQERLIMRKEDTLLEGGRQFTYYPILDKNIILGR